MDKDITTDFNTDERLGAEACRYFSDWLTNKSIRYTPATTEQQHQGIDIVTELHTYEVKHQTYDTSIIIEESSMHGAGSGWIYKSQAMYLIEVSPNRDKFFKMDMSELKYFYAKCSHNYKLHNNYMTNGNRGDNWISTFKCIQLSSIMGFVNIDTFLL